MSCGTSESAVGHFFRAKGTTEGVSKMPEYTEEQMEELVAEKIAGLQTKNSELLGAQKDLKGKLARFDGLDPERLAELEKAEGSLTCLSLIFST